MERSMDRFRTAALLVALTTLALLVSAGIARAQGTNSSIRGYVLDASGPVADAIVVAVDAASGFHRSAKSGEDGAFNLAGLSPGTYEITVSGGAYGEQKQTVTVLIGQDVEANFRLSPSEVLVESVTVVGERSPLLIDTRNSEIATNVTQQQIQALPQNNRNFLAFAGLAPGVRFSDDQDAAGQTFRSGGANPKQVNVFVDGLSYKNDVIQGGAFMQDSSRGNPFPQDAVQEYKVLTQNYKAEYEKATAAVITAVTKSGGNDLRGNAFYLFQDKSLVSQDDFSKDRGEKKAEYDRDQYGLTLGGPVSTDRMHFFVAAERNERDVVSSVVRGALYDAAPANVRSLLDGYRVGAIAAPLDSKLYFGKLSWQPAEAQTLDFTYHRRDEQEIRGFGGARVEQGAESFEVGTDVALLQHQWVRGNQFNEARLSYQKLAWAQDALDTSIPHLNYIGLLDVGAKDTIQDLDQTRLGLRDDFSWYVDWHGSHSIKTGVTFTDADYSFFKQQGIIPTYEFRANEGWQIPFRANIGLGNPGLDFGNQQYGVYVQDDWAATSRLTFNVGLRWDYETNMLNNDFVTPAGVANGLRTACRNYDTAIGGRNNWCIRDTFDVENYISDGDNRESYANMYQPRVGFSWDARGDGRTVVFGGWGLYYDRVTLNDIFDEQFRYEWKRYTFCFSETGGPVTDCGAGIKWDPRYLTAAGLEGLIASGSVPGPEIYLLPNDTKPPRSTQWTLGLRQQFGSWLTSLSYANSEGKNGLVWSFGTLPPGTPFNDRWGSWIQIPNYGFILRGFDIRETSYEGVFLTLDRPMTSGSRWGANIAYSYGKAKQDASLDEGTAFAFDVLPDDFEPFPANQDERHRLVMSGTVQLPANFQVSSLISLGSGSPVSVPDASAGWDKFVFRFNDARPEKYDFIIPDAWAYRSVDLRLQWEAPPIANRYKVSIALDGFNIFDFDNFNYEPWVSFFKPPTGEVNDKFGQPTSEYSTRRFQVGLRLNF
jgi:outer membrane receptor protein involved in Fe transport